MQKRLRRFAIGVMVALGLLVPVATVVESIPVMAAPCEANEVDTNLFGCVRTDSNGSGIKRLLSLVVTVLLYGIGAAAVVGVVWAGFLYLTARDNEAQVAKAKTRLIEVAIGLVAWALLFTLLQWLIPNFTGSTLESEDSSYVVTDSTLA